MHLVSSSTSQLRCWRPCRRSLPRGQCDAGRACRQASRHRWAFRSASDEEVELVPPVLLSPISSVDEFKTERQWVADMVRCWLDEEYTPLEVHQALGDAAGQAYTKLRQQGQDDVSDLVLELANELLTFNYRETFVNAFEVSNKIVQLLMIRQGCDVCCASADDLTAIERYEELLSAEKTWH